MLDVHILTLPTSNKKWFTQCLASVEEARREADFDVKVHVVEGVEGNIGQGRKLGYSQGTYPWKTYVDHDDYILPSAFAVLGKYMQDSITAIAPREYVEQNRQYHNFTVPNHHLITYRSEYINSIDWDSWRHFGDVLAERKAAMAPNKLVKIDDVLYVHRIYLNSGGRRCRQQYPEERERLVEALK